MCDVPLFDHQKKIVDFVLNRLFVNDQKGAAVFADIGTGKTRAILTALETLYDLGEFSSALIVAPLRILDYTWPNEIQKWSTSLKFKRVNGTPVSYINDPLCLVTPDSLHKVLEAAKNRKFDLLVVDESPKFKTWTTRRMKLMRQILPYIPKRVIMTGTPTANSLAELHGQMFIVDDGDALGKNITVFRSRYMDKGGWKARQWKLRENSKQDIVGLVAPLSVRVDARDVTNMPALVVNNVLCSLPPEAQKQHKTMKQELYAALRENDEVLAGSAGAAYSKCKQIANGFLYREDKSVAEVHRSKLDTVEEILEETGSAQVLLFYEYTADAERIKKVVGACSHLRGGQSDKASRAEIASWFSGKHRIMLAQISAVGHGLNLQDNKAAHIIMFNLPDSGELYLQGIGRLQRQGGAERIFLHRIIADGSIDMVARDRVDGKITTQEQFLKRVKEWTQS